MVLCTSSEEYHGWESVGKEKLIVIKSRHHVLVVECLLVSRVSWSFVRKWQDSCKGLAIIGLIYMVCGIKG